MDHTFKGVYEQVGDWYFAYAPELPGANTQGRSMDEARENLREAIQMILQANAELAERELTGKRVLREPVTVKVA